MTNIAIIGGGQAGLQLGIGLKKSMAGFGVSIYTNRDADEIAKGKIMSSQGMFENALKFERELGINFWDNISPNDKSVTFNLLDPKRSTVGLSWQGLTSHFFRSIDQRIKFPRWMQEFQNLGGELFIQEVNANSLSEIAKKHDLTIISGGKADISQLFSRDNTRSIFNQPQRKLACLYVHGVMPSAYPGVRSNVIPGVGEFCRISGLTHSGDCEMFLFEGLPGGPFDCWDNKDAPEAQLQQALRLLKQFVPNEYELCYQSELTDGNAVLCGGYTPTVKLPTFRLADGTPILGMGDAVVLNDPIAGQGANNASKNAAFFLKRIIENKKGSFTEEWMKESFELYWNQNAKWSTQWTDLLLLPPPPHIIQLMTVAATSPKIASFLANAFNDPAGLFPWIESPEETQKFIESSANLDMPVRNNVFNFQPTIARM